MQLEIAAEEGLGGEIQVEGDLLDRVHGRRQLRFGLQDDIVLDPPDGGFPAGVLDQRGHIFGGHIHLVGIITHLAVLAAVVFHQLQEPHHHLALPVLRVIFRGSRMGDPAHYQEKQVHERAERFLLVGARVLHQIVQQVEIGAEGGRRLLVQLVEGIALHARVEQVGVAESDAGQEVVRQEKEGPFEVFADLVGFNDLGGQHDQEGVSPEAERAQVDGAGTAALVAAVLLAHILYFQHQHQPLVIILTLLQGMVLQQ